jgi:molecular chaperone GrpE
MNMPEEQVPSEERDVTEAGSPAGETTAAAAAASLDEQMATLQRERDEYYNLLLRARAEFDNYRKRVDRERLELIETASADLLHDLLPIVDDLERALAAPADAEAAEPYRRGVELIHRQLLELLRQRGARPVEALGATFDPHLHQAVAHEPAPGRRDGEIIEEYRRGYTLGNRLLRPSMVKVAAGE